MMYTHCSDTYARKDSMSVIRRMPCTFDMAVSYGRSVK